MGMAYAAANLGLCTAAALSIVVYSATAQSVIMGMWEVPLPVQAMVLACLATNARYLIMGVDLRGSFDGLPRRIMLPILFLLADASWLMSTADSKRHGPDAGYLLGASVPMAFGWVAGTIIGYQAPLPVGSWTKAIALLPVFFIVTLLPAQWRGRSCAVPWATAASAAWLAGHLVGPNWAMLVGGIAGVTANASTSADV